jgi:peptidoglycan/xylan/chitin deacetylase (PgdA/CDA1 family)
VRAVRAIAAAGLAAAAWSAPAPAPVVPAVAAVFGIRRRLGRPGIALTFDDGPHPRGTPAVLEHLARRGAVATFFLVGEQVERHPALAAEIAAAGHEIALHGHRHTLLLRRAPRALRRDLDHAHAVIEDATGRSPTFYRPPYGVFSAAGLELCRRRAWEPALWSLWGRDWGARATPAAIARRASSGLAAGDIVLLHDSDEYSARDCWRRTVAALPAIVDAALASGQPLVRLSVEGSSA